MQVRRAFPPAHARLRCTSAPSRRACGPLRAAAVDRALRGLEALGVEQLDGVGGLANKAVGILVRLEIGEDPIGEGPRVAPLRPPNADAQPQELGRREVLRNGADAVVAGRSTAEPRLQPA